MTKRKKGIIAFVTPEVFISENIHTGAGGLGEFSRAVLTAAHKKGTPLVGFSILPREGYYDQGLDPNTGMTVSYTPRYYPDVFQDTGIRVHIEIAGEPLTVAVHRLPAGTFGFSELFLFDADIPENKYLGRFNTLGLYGGGHMDRPDDYEGSLDRKICQSLLIGKATVALIDHLALDIRTIHVNESHCAFTAVELFCRYKAAGMPNPLQAVREKVRFTTHTPVDAGNPRYPIKRLAHLSGYSEVMLAQICSDDHEFSMTGVCVYLAGRTNAVSKRHLRKARELVGMYSKNDLIAITNGVSQDFWQYPEFREARSTNELMQAKRKYQDMLVAYVQERTGRTLRRDTMIIVWARRFAEYKRPKLICYDFEWFRESLYSNRFQMIYAGKPHPDDKTMIGVWNDLYCMSKILPNLIILPGFDMEMNRILKAGADVWLNTPRAPYEACGTSGMSAVMLGAMNCSTPDGWMFEANPDNAFLFGSNGVHDMDQDPHDASELRKCIDRKIAPMFYGDTFRWYSKVLAGKLESERDFTNVRMFCEYRKLLYT